MGEYQELLQERADLIAEAQRIHAGAAAENRDLTAEEAARDDAIAAQLTKLNARIGRLERLREHERQAASARLDDSGATYPPARVGHTISGLHDRREDDPRQGFAGLGDFAMAVRAASAPGGSVDERLRYGAAPSNYLERSGASGEGYLVPSEFRAGIWSLVFADPVLERFSFEPTETGSVELLADETTPWGTTGIVARWRAEGALMTASKPGVKKRRTETDQLYAFVTATNELLRDVPLLNDRLGVKAAEAITWKLAEAIIRGNGAGQPLGILTAAAKVQVAKESGQAADTVVAANVAKMWSRLIKAGGSPFWLLNDDVMPQLMTMTISNQPIWLPPSAFISAPGGTLLGLPVYNSEHADTVGDEGDIILVNPAGYHAIRRTGAPEFASSIHLYFDYNMTAFRWTFEVGGQPYLEAAITPPNSSATKSHFVTLAARA